MTGQIADPYIHVTGYFIFYDEYVLLWKLCGVLFEKINVNTPYMITVFPTAYMPVYSGTNGIQISVLGTLFIVFHSLFSVCNIE